MPEWGDFLLTERGTDRDREVAGGIQYEAAAFVARLQAASTSGPQPSGCTKRKFSGPGCDVNSLIRAGTKTRASHLLKRPCVILKHHDLARMPTDLLSMLYEDYSTKKQAVQKLNDW